MFSKIEFTKYAYVNGNPNGAIDPFGLQTFGIGIEVPPAAAVSNGVLNLRVDTGHTFAYLLDDANTLTNTLSVGPAEAINPTGLSGLNFLAGNLDAKSDWSISGKVSTYGWHLTAAQYKTCSAAFNKMKKNPGKYTPKNQCTSSAIALAGQCGISVPNGVSAVALPPIFSDSVPNPYGLSQQLNQTMTPVISDGSWFRKH